MKNKNNKKIEIKIKVTPRSTHHGANKKIKTNPDKNILHKGT